jgi:hypothetical protein
MRDFMVVVGIALALAVGLGAGAGELQSRDSEGIVGGWGGEFSAAESWEQAMAEVGQSKRTIELADASIIIEVNATDGDAGFQVFVDGEGWRNVRVFEPNGRKIFHAMVFGGIRRIGGGTELFLETEEPEFEDLEELEDLIELLPEGEYRFIARTTGNDWAVGSAELTHVVPAGPVLLEPLPAPGEECATGVSGGNAVISWEPVTTTIQGSPDISIVAYRVIVEDEDAGFELNLSVDAGTTAITIPAEFLTAGTEYAFEVLAIEEGGNQTITESCFVTE